MRIISLFLELRHILFFSYFGDKTYSISDEKIEAKVYVNQNEFCIRCIKRQLPYLFFMNYE